MPTRPGSSRLQYASNTESDKEGDFSSYLLCSYYMNVWLRGTANDHTWSQGSIPAPVSSSRS